MPPSTSLFFRLRQLFTAGPAPTGAGLRLPALFSDHMVLQRDQPCRIWGWDDPGATITVDFADLRRKSVAGSDGRWEVTLSPLAASAKSRPMVVVGTTRREFSDVVVGEVWLCSGQSNMEQKLPMDYNGDLAVLAAANDQLRFLQVPNLGTQEPQRDFLGTWKLSSLATAAQASAVGYYFGDYLQRILRVPVGLIDNSWGGSNAEAWVERAAVAAEPRLKEMLLGTIAEEAYLASSAAGADYADLLARWQDECARARETWHPSGVSLPEQPLEAERWMEGNRRTGNLHAGVLNPLIGYSVKGAIWYQGEGNTDRAVQYVDLFPFLIRTWREAWGQGDFPFYWVQLPGFRAEVDAPGDSDWAELREAQTRTLSLPRTGQAVAIDLGEGRDIHPRQKLLVAARLARLALARDYGYDLPHESPRYRDHVIADGRIVVTIDCFGDVLHTFGILEAKGFAVCGVDHIWHHANACLVSDEMVEVWSKDVPQPVAVRYAWADNPVCNLFASKGLPVTPFRTDDFPLITAGVEVPKPAFPHP